MRAPEHVNTTQLAQALQAKGVLIEPGEPFFGGEGRPKHFYRLAYSSIPAAGFLTELSWLPPRLGKCRDLAICEIQIGPIAHPPHTVLCPKFVNHLQTIDRSLPHENDH